MAPGYCCVRYLVCQQDLPFRSGAARVAGPDLWASVRAGSGQPLAWGRGGSRKRPPGVGAGRRRGLFCFCLSEARSSRDPPSSPLLGLGGLTIGRAGTWPVANRKCPWCGGELWAAGLRRGALRAGGPFEDRPLLAPWWAGGSMASVSRTGPGRRSGDTGRMGRPRHSPACSAKASPDSWVPRQSQGEGEAVLLTPWTPGNNAHVDCRPESVPASFA